MKKQLSMILFTFLFFYSCEDQIVSECEDDIRNELVVNTNFTSIQNKVFSTTCAVSGCHVANSQDPVLTEGQAYNNIVNVVSFNPPFLYVNPFKSDSSYIINKLRGVNIQGERMPFLRDPLNAAVIDSIAAWIDNGALNN